MANLSNDVPNSPPVVTAPVITAPVAPAVPVSRGTSRLSLMLAFAAGAAFSWLIISLSDEDNAPQTTTAPGVTITRQR